MGKLISNSERLQMKCVTCGRAFFMYRAETWSDGQFRGARSDAIHYMDRRGFFCKLRCAARYGVSAALARFPEGEIK